MTMTMSLIKNGLEVDWTTFGDIVYRVAQHCLGEPHIEEDGDVVFKFDVEKFKNGCKDWINRLIDGDRFEDASEILFALKFVSKYGNSIEYIRFEW